VVLLATFLCLLIQWMAPPLHPPAAARVTAGRASAHVAGAIHRVISLASGFFVDDRR
jgi:hypothetical protein